MRDSVESKDQQSRLVYLEGKCSFLIQRLADTILTYTAEGCIPRVESAALFSPVPAPPPHGPPSESDALISGAFLAILGRPPSDGDLAFYRSILEKHGRTRLVRDVFLSKESINRNTIPLLVQMALQLFWKT